MQNVADLLIAGFIFLLFVSIYRKRSSAEVRYWMLGWLFVLLHFGALAGSSATAIARAAQGAIALGTLVLCGTAFALSHPEAHKTRDRTFWISVLLAGPWLAVMLLDGNSSRAFLVASCAAVASHLGVLAVCLWLFGPRRPKALAGIVLVVGCAMWLTQAIQARDGGEVQAVVLTLCFGWNAILLSGRSRRFSVAGLTTSLGAVCWALVWVSARIVGRHSPAIAVSPEIWNLPKYFVAAGMILSLLEEEIHTTELASEQYRLLFAGNPHPMWIYDPETLRFLDVNEAAVAYYGYSRNEFRAITVPEIFHPGTDLGAMDELRTAEPQVLSGPWLHLRKDGSEMQVDMASQSVMREGRIVTFALIHDVTEPQRLQAQLFRQAHHDVLTGLPNRALFEETLQATLDDAARTGRKAAVFCIDLDRFKQINDTYGHSAGDLCLCEMARRITHRLQDAGTLARTGGDEFMLVVGQLEMAETAEHLASLLLRDLKPAVQVDTGEVELIASIGIAVYPNDGTESVQLWRDADAAMYQAKRAGGARWVRVSEEISQLAAEINELEIGLRRSLKTGDFLLLYQPQMTAAGELHSLEALIRFTDPYLCRATPAKVISLAEETGLIVPLGEWVLEEVCRQTRAWLDEGYEAVQVGVNVSSLQLNRFNFSLKVASTLERHHLSPHLIEFEVTESTMMPDNGELSEQIALLARMGTRFAVDDFGTGYSSLGRLHQLPVEAVKIDSSFTRNIADRKGLYHTVRAIIALAHSLGMRVVAEGVEDEEQLRILRSLQCDRMQGFLFSEPLPAELVRELLPRADVARLQARAV